MKDKTYQTILVICLGLVVLSALTHSQPLLLAAVVIGVASLISKKLASLIELAWLKFSEALGKVMSSLILSLVFFIFLTPIALIYRLKDKDDLALKPQVGDSLFVTRNYEFKASDLEFIKISI